MLPVFSRLNVRADLPRQIPDLGGKLIILNSSLPATLSLRPDWHPLLSHHLSQGLFQFYPPDHNSCFLWWNPAGKGWGVLPICSPSKLTQVLSFPCFSEEVLSVSNGIHLRCSSELPLYCQQHRYLICIEFQSYWFNPKIYFWQTEGENSSPGLKIACQRDWEWVSSPVGGSEPQTWFISIINFYLLFLQCA